MVNKDNIAYACLTKFCLEGSADQVNTRWINRDLSFEDVTYASIESQSNQIANILKNLGIHPGDVVSIFLPRSPILVSTFFGILKHQALACILFSTLGEEGLLDRLQNSTPRFVITKKSLVHKLLAIRSRLESPVVFLLVDIEEHQSEDVYSLPKLLRKAGTVFDYPHQLDPATPAFLQYTSGSTGKPKGALHVHGALEDMQQSFVEIMNPKAGDIFWCTADPAWITGLVYGIIAPMITKTLQLQFTGGYNATNWLKLLDQEKVSIWYTAPTALRMLMQENEQIFLDHDLSSLARIYSVGEPLNPEIYAWGKKVFGKEIYDTWFQSETGCIMIANRPGLPVKPGSMGVPRSGITVQICDDNMKLLPTGEQGHLCVVPGWKSMYRTYFRRESAYQEKFRDNLYVTGDLAKKDEQGYIWYISRSDDVINTGGHLVGPFEVESALLEVEEIGDVAVIGAHDPILHQKIVAFIVLRDGILWNRVLELKCRMHVSDKVSTT
ncbi:MAG: AMP-binding protein, partial [Anaerolineaceae bacterium]|nr:AMP-binding protein [Anaerolineaceae bacterium]